MDRGEPVSQSDRGGMHPATLREAGDAHIVMIVWAQIALLGPRLPSVGLGTAVSRIPAEPSHIAKQLTISRASRSQTADSRAAKHVATALKPKRGDGIFRPGGDQHEQRSQ